MFYKRSTFTHYLYSAIGKLSPFVCFHNRSAAGAPHFAYTLPDQSGKVRYDVPLHTSARRKSSPPLSVLIAEFSAVVFRPQKGEGRRVNDSFTVHRPPSSAPI